MPKRVVTINYPKCQPELCASGICQGILACPQKILRQEAAYEAPMTIQSICKGCAKCIWACPFKAIELN